MFSGNGTTISNGSKYCVRLHCLGDGQGRWSHSSVWSAWKILGHDWQIHLWSAVWFIANYPHGPPMVSASGIASDNTERHALNVYN